jgi:hypothetical protein
MATPTKYKKEFCQELITHMATGKSFDAFGGVVGVCHQTLYNWLETHEDFQQAKSVGELKGLNQWETIGLAGMMGKIKGFNPVSWIFVGKCRFRKYGYKDHVDEAQLIEVIDRSEAARARLHRLEQLLEERACWQKKSSIPLEVVQSPSGLLTESLEPESKTSKSE